MYCHYIHKQYEWVYKYAEFLFFSLKNELTSEEYTLYARWCEAVHKNPVVAETLQDKYENMNVSCGLFEAFVPNLSDVWKVCWRARL